MVRSKPMTINMKLEPVTVRSEFGHQYDYFHEDIDPCFPIPLINGIDLTIFADSDHCHDKLTGISVSGLIVFLASTPIHW